MRMVLTFCLFAVALQQQNCSDSIREMRSPEKTKGMVEEKLQPYFPNVKAVMLPEKHAILALTCVQGAGPEFVGKIRDLILNDPETTKPLAMLKVLPFIGGARYRYFVLGFDNGWVWYDIDNRTVSMPPVQDAYVAGYRQDCGFSQ
jgi:hypothetical protein